MQFPKPRSFTSDSAKIRPAAVVGQFYPSQPVELCRMIQDFLRQTKPGNAAAPKAVIAPHAGYVYSGPIAASAYARFASERDVITRVVLIGPSHFLPFEGLAASGAKAFATPLGLVPVDTDTVRQICSRRQAAILDAAHAREHSLEVHLPFLQVVLSSFKIIPLLAGDVTGEHVAEAIEALWGGPETRFVISSDLSHYHEYAEAREMDAATSQAIERLEPDRIGEEQACGRIPICGLLRASRKRGLRAQAVDLRNSGDTAGTRERVVGYGAFLLER